MSHRSPRRHLRPGYDWAVVTLARYAWFVLIYNVGVIAWGAYVRATGSGAGCGSRWPLCNGEIVPRAPSVTTAIEFSHRVTSGLALVAVAALVWWTWRDTRPGHPLRAAAAWSLAFMLSEALLGAGLVLFGLVADNASGVRAVVVAAHLLNTFLLLAALTMSVWWASTGAQERRAHRHRETWRLATAAAALLVVSCTGAIAALGDTLFPSTSISEALAADFSSASHVLVRLRTLHPILAVMTTLYLASTVWRIAEGRPSAVTIARAISWLLAAQIGAGLLNVLLLAPVWLQMAHLLLADAVWIAYIFLMAEARSTTRDAATAAMPYARPA